MSITYLENACPEHTHHRDRVVEAVLVNGQPRVRNRFPTDLTGAIVTGEAAGGLTVPTEAIQTVDGASVVFVQVPNGFQARPVLVGRQAGGRTEILRGLDGSERVAGANAFLLKAELAKGEAEHGH